jgi:hypothetical protein
VDDKSNEKGSNNAATDAATKTAKNAASGNANSNASPSHNANSNSHSKDPSKFDWVTSRSACTLPKVFATLRQQVEEDVKTRNAQRPTYAPYEFSVADDIDAFTVFLKAKDLSRSVTFKLNHHAIAVQDDQANARFQVRVQFNDAGECRLRVDEQERELWQVRRMALEDLMFRQE